MGEPIDLSKIKPGDEVTVRARVYALRDGGLTIRALHDNGATSVRPEHVVSHSPALAVGDRVKAPGWETARFRIVCIHGLWAWLADAEDSMIQAPLSDLERVDG